MYSKIKIFGHPVHPMLVSFPITFYTAAFVCFVIYQTNGNPFWHNVALLSNIAGVVTALLAAVPGLLEWWLGIPKDTAAKKRGALHGALNVVALLFFAANWFALRGTLDNPPADNFWPVVLTAIGLGVTMVAGWHGYALIGTHKVGVDLSPQQEMLETREEIRKSA